MSWDAYVASVVGYCGGAADKACIIGLDGSKWTSDAPEGALPISADEAGVIARAINNEDNSSFQASGIVIGSVKYQFLRGEEGVYLGKKKDNGAVTLQKTNQAIIIGHTKEGASQGSTNQGVGKMADYFISIGY